MKKELINTFFLAFAAFFIATTTNSVATNGLHNSYKMQQEEACKDYWGLEKLFSQAKTTDGETIRLDVKTKCNVRNNENYVKNEDLKFERSSSSKNKTY